MNLAIIRSMSTKEGDHGRATYYLRTGYLPQGPIRYPTLGSLVANELDDESAELPGFVSISPVRAINAAAFSLGVSGTEVRAAERRRAESGRGRGRGNVFAAGRRSRRSARHRPPASRRTARADADI